MIEAHLYYCFVFFIILLSPTGKNIKILKILSTFSWFLMTILTVTVHANEIVEIMNKKKQLSD